MPLSSRLSMTRELRLRSRWADAAALGDELREVEQRVPDGEKEAVHDAACAVESAADALDALIRRLETCLHCGYSLDGPSVHAETLGGAVLHDHGNETRQTLRGMNEAMALNKRAGLCPRCGKAP